MKINEQMCSVERKERIDMHSLIKVDKEDLYTLKVNCKGKRTVGKTNKGINIEKTVCLKN